MARLREQTNILLLQGDPMGPLEFCTTIHPILLLLKLELKVAFLADLTQGGKADAVAHDVQLIAQESANLGLTQPRKVRNNLPELRH